MLSHFLDRWLFAGKWFKQIHKELSIEKKWCAYRCYLSDDHLAQLCRIFSGNPSFNCKCTESIHYILEIALLITANSLSRSKIDKISTINV